MYSWTSSLGNETSAVAVNYNYEEGHMVSEFIEKGLEGAVSNHEARFFEGNGSGPKGTDYRKHMYYMMYRLVVDTDKSPINLTYLTNIERVVGPPKFLNLLNHWRKTCLRDRCRWSLG